MTSLALECEDLSATIPENYRLVWPRKIETGEEVNAFTRIGEVAKLNIPVWEIPAKGRSLLAKPAIGVRIWSEEGFYFAENDQLVIYGSGSSRGEALADFYTHIVHFYDYYRNLKDGQVIGEAARLKHLFSEVFTEE
ncbi:MAG: hypothetical protein HY644_06910 [Acidobacteria bacterium]|nr:hypothetical protein [Acidobacteriota bacterium]